MDLQLNHNESHALLSSHKQGNGGWQGLLRKLSNQLNPRTYQIRLDDRDLERITRYAFRYGNGGWETQLMNVFGRHLGSNQQGA